MAGRWSAARDAANNEEDDRKWEISDYADMPTWSHLVEEIPNHRAASADQARPNGSWRSEGGTAAEEDRRRRAAEPSTSEHHVLLPPPHPANDFNHERFLSSLRYRLSSLITPLPTGIDQPTASTDPSCEAAVLQRLPRQVPHDVDSLGNQSADQRIH